MPTWRNQLTVVLVVAPIVIGLPLPERDHQGTLAINPNVAVDSSRKAYRYDLPTVADIAVERRGSSSRKLQPETSSPAEQIGDSISLRAVGSSSSLERFGSSEPVSLSFLEPSQVQPVGEAAEELPIGDSVEEIAEPQFAQMLPELCPCPYTKPPLPSKRQMFRLATRNFCKGYFSPEGRGVGFERVANAIFAIDTTEPQPKLGIRMGGVNSFQFPDRAEYFWARPQATGGKGPAPEVMLDYQEIRFQWELGGPKFTTMTDLPIRALDPANHSNTAGQADMTVTTKLLMMDGERWQITQLMRTYIPMASFKRGLSPGHASLEPGILFRYRHNDCTFHHAQLKYWFAPGGNDPDWGGEVLTYGFGVSRLWLDTDTFAIIPTAELVGATILDGRKTVALNGAFQEIDTESPVDLHLGLRFARENGPDMGLMEYGTALSIGLGRDRWYDSQFLFEVRWIY